MTGPILVTGAGGFIGSAVVRELAARGHRVRAAGRGDLPAFTGEVERVVADMRDRDAVARLLGGCSAVVHAASASTPASTAGDPAGEIHANLVPTAHLLEVLQAMPAVPLLYLSSAGTLYAPDDTHAAIETDAPRPRSYHGAGKVAAEAFIGAWCAQFDRTATILRPTNVYGPGQFERAGFGIIPAAFGHLRRGTPVVVWGDGSAVRDYLYIDDLARLCALALAAPMAAGARIVNAASGAPVRLDHLLERIEAAAGIPLAREFRGGRAVDAPRVAVDPALAAKLFGWRAQTTLDQGLARTWAWFGTIRP